MAATVLIISPAGRLRDGLCTILRSFPSIGEIYAEDDFELGYELAAQHHPSITIVDADDAFEEQCILLKRLLSRVERARCLVITNTMRQAAQARQVGADAVLLRGFSTNALQRTLVSLAVIPENALSGEQAKFKRQRVTAVPLEQKK